MDSIKGVFKRAKAEIEEGSNQPQQPDPAMIKMQQDQANRQQDNQIKMMEMQNKDKELQLKIMQEDKKLALDSQRVQSDTMKTQSDIRNDSMETAIKQQDADRKDRELVVETEIAQAEILTGIQAPIIAGDVGSVG